MKLPRRPTGERSQSGETLIEVLMASALMALVVVAIMGGMVTMLLGSTVHRAQADANSLLIAAMERVKSTDVTRVHCAPKTQPTYVAAAQAAIPAGSLSVVTIDSITYEVITKVGGIPTMSFGGACNPATPTILPLQLVTITLKTHNERATASLSFVKGDN